MPSLSHGRRPAGEFVTSGVVDTERNNSSLNDLNVENQKLDQDEIAALKNSGKVWICGKGGRSVD